jgi:hypothetical protein
MKQRNSEANIDGKLTKEKIVEMDGRKRNRTSHVVN